MSVHHAGVGITGRLAKIEKLRFDGDGNEIERIDVSDKIQGDGEMEIGAGPGDAPTPLSDWLTPAKEGGS